MQLDDFKMTAATCAVLAQVFPLILVTIAIEHRRALQIVRRGEKVFGGLVEYGIGFALFGLVITVVGVQTAGLIWVFSSMVWLMFSFTVLVLVFLLMGIVEGDRDERAARLARERESAEKELLAALDDLTMAKFPVNSF